MITVDFETHGIVGNPIVNPPTPVGVAIWVEGQEPEYYSWGHPVFEVGDPRYPAGSGNNISFDQIHQYLKQIRDGGEPLLFHNAAFDVSVWNETFCNATLWSNEHRGQIHDTMFLLFLADPYASSYSLKPSAVRYLGLPPTEQDELHTWILSNVPEATGKTAGAYICRAPASLVGPYAIGDVVRTRGLFNHLHPQIVNDGMGKAYDRERALLPILMEATERGVRINRELLHHHETVYTECLTLAQDRLCERMGVSRSVLDSDSLLADALEQSGAVTEWVLTKTGKRSMAKENLKIVHPEIKSLVEYCSALETCLSTFMRPWLSFSEHSGRLHPNWNQVRGDHGNGHFGTRTGRLSSDHPNFQNVPTEFDKIIIPDQLHPLPKMRIYCLPEDGHVWLKRDFSSQELRILAHFEDGSLCIAYKGNPELDPHQMAIELIHNLIGITYARKDIKITGFSLIYGSGVRGLSQQLGRTYEEAYGIKNAYLDALPGVRELMYDVQSRGRSGQSIKTWGGRIYFAEPPKEIDGQLRDFAYKLLNYLIQGSAADQTKDCIVEWDKTREWYDTFLATVHDEINISVPTEHAESSMQALKEEMNKDRFDVPMRSDGFMGPNWQELVEHS